MRKERDFNKTCKYKIEIFPLSILNIQDFEGILNNVAIEGWELKHIFTTVGMKLVVIWEK